MADLHSKILDMRPPIQFSSFLAVFREISPNNRFAAPFVLGTPSLGNPLDTQQ